jgi:aspartate/glutamate racemase
VIEDDSRDEYRRIMATLVERGAEAILLGCTEIDLLVRPEDSPVPVFDTQRTMAAGAAFNTVCALVAVGLPVFKPGGRLRRAG